MFPQLANCQSRELIRGRGRSDMAGSAGVPIRQVPPVGKEKRAESKARPFFYVVLFTLPRFCLIFVSAPQCVYECPS